jgi:hypothetical protein
MAASAREFLGKRRTLGEVNRTYLRGMALEVDTYDWFDLRRRRLQLDEVRCITLHRQARTATVAVAAVFATLFLGIAAAMFRPGDEGTGWIFFGILGATGVLIALVGLVAPEHVVNVISPRARVTIMYSGRPGRAREVYRLLAERTEAAQRAAAAVQGVPQTT